MPQTALSSNKKNLYILHLTVFIWGFTGILGALVSVDAVQMVWYRVLIATATLFVYFLTSKTSLKVTRKQGLKFFFTGSIVALHWVLFFHAIKVSTVSVTLVCLSSFTLFTAILEPLIKKQHIQKSDIFIGLIIIAGIYMIFKFESQYTLGIILGLSAALASSIFSIINSTFVQHTEAKIIGFYEMAGALIWMTIYRIFDQSLFTETFSISLHDWLYLLILGTICTALAYVAGVSVMKTISAFQVALITNLEPVYGIILAFLFFGQQETMTPGFYIGALLVLGAVFIYPIYKKRQQKM